MKKPYTLIKRAMLLGSLLLFLGSVFTPQANAQLTKTSPEGLALMALYNSAGGVNWTKSTNWGSNEDLDDWYGVTVSDDGTKLLELNLANNNLVGLIPPEIRDLTDLTFLHLKQNELVSPIPIELGYLDKLTFLGLNDNLFTGALPAALSTLLDLQELYLHKNAFTGTFPDFSSFTELKYLYISENNFDAIHAGITSLSDLDELRVNENLFVFDDLIPLIGIARDFYYEPQKEFGVATTIPKNVGEALDIYSGLSTITNTYRWYKDGSLLAGKTSNPFSIASLSLTDDGVYYTKVKNPALPDLTLVMKNQTVVVTAGPSIFPDWYVSTNGTGNIEVIIDKPAVVSPAITEGLIYSEVFDAGAFSYKVVSNAVDFTAPANPDDQYVWTANGISPYYPLRGDAKTHKVKIKIINTIYINRI